MSNPDSDLAPDADGPSSERAMPRAVTIIGPGLLGASVGLAIKAIDPEVEVTGLSRRKETGEAALRLGAIDVAETDPERALVAAELVVVAVPLSGFAGAFEQISRHAPLEAVVTDVGSTKASVQADAEAHLARDERFVGAHPMAGSEQKGPEHAKAELFRGKPCVLCPSARSTEPAQRIVRHLWASLGMRLMEMSPEMHDAQTAVISHLPHLAAVALMQTAVDRGGLGLASSGLRDTTRLASSNPPMRRDIVLNNRDAVALALGTMIERLQGLREAVEVGDADRLMQALEQAKRQRDRWLDQ